MDEAVIIGQYQPMLQAIAYRMVGSLEDAEDIVQDTFLKWLSTDRSKIENTRAYLVRAVTNNCLSHLEFFKKKKDTFIANIQPEAMIEKYRSVELPHFDFEAELSEAMALLHKRLEPMEKAVFVLREVFELEYDALQELLNQKKENCRQMLCRARQKIQQDTRSLKLDRKWQNQYLESFRKAANFGKLNDFMSEVSSEVEQYLKRN